MEVLKVKLVFVCDKCGKKFVSYQARASHIKLMHEAHKSRFRCTICEKICRDAYNLRRHIRLVHEKTQKERCMVCGSGIRKKWTPQQLKQYGIRVETDPLKIVCDKCGQYFASFQARASHVKWVHDARKRPFQCAICDKQCRDGYNLRRHLHLAHEKTPKERCIVCGCSISKKWAPQHFKQHGIHMETETLTFADSTTFENWKTQVERESNSKFVKQHSAKRGKDGIEVNELCCHRSGNFKSRGKGIRKLRAKGSIRINGYCPASMVTSLFPNGEIIVTFQKTHVCHMILSASLDSDSVAKAFISCSEGALVPFSEEALVPCSEATVLVPYCDAEEITPLQYSGTEELAPVQYICTEEIEPVQYSGTEALESVQYRGTEEIEPVQYSGTDEIAPVQYSGTGEIAPIPNTDIGEITFVPYSDSEEITLVPYAEETITSYSDSEETVVPYSEEITVVPHSDSEEITVVPHSNSEEITVVPHSDSEETTVVPHSDSEEITVVPHSDSEGITFYQQLSRPIQTKNTYVCDIEERKINLLAKFSEIVKAVKSNEGLTALERHIAQLDFIINSAEEKAVLHSQASEIVQEPQNKKLRPERKFYSRNKKSVCKKTELGNPPVSEYDAVPFSVVTQILQDHRYC